MLHFEWKLLSFGFVCLVFFLTLFLWRHRMVVGGEKMWDDRTTKSKRKSCSWKQPTDRNNFLILLLKHLPSSLFSDSSCLFPSLSVSSRLFLCNPWVMSCLFESINKTLRKQNGSFPEMVFFTTFFLLWLRRQENIFFLSFLSTCFFCWVSCPFSVSGLSLLQESEEDRKSIFATGTNNFVFL